MLQIPRSGPCVEITVGRETASQNRRDDLDLLRAGLRKIKLDESRKPDRQRKAKFAGLNPNEKYFADESWSETGDRISQFAHHGRYDRLRRERHSTRKTPTRSDGPIFSGASGAFERRIINARAVEPKSGGVQGIAQAAIRPVGKTSSRATRPARTSTPSVRCPPSNPH